MHCDGIYMKIVCFYHAVCTRNNGIDCRSLLGQLLVDPPAVHLWGPATQGPPCVPLALRHASDREPLIRHEGAEPVQQLEVGCRRRLAGTKKQTQKFTASGHVRCEHGYRHANDMNGLDPALSNLPYPF
jgi:hypothetical protein